MSEQTSATSTYAPVPTPTAPKLKCQWLHSAGNTCQKEAEWMATFPCCRFDMFLCAVHQAGGEIAMTAGNTVHALCRKEIKEMEWAIL